MPKTETNIEQRTFKLDSNIEIREEGEGKRLKGHAAVFNEWANIGGWFEERIIPGAFKDSIKEDDVRALFNHDANFVLGRNTAGTLSMAEDKTGLAVDIDPPDTQFASDLMTSIGRGDINQMSFAFRVIEEKWIAGEDKELDKREIIKAQLFDVSPVTYPAYTGTDIALASRSKAIGNKETKSNSLSRADLNVRKLDILKRR